MNTDLHNFEQFMKRRADVARAYMNGDAAPLRRIATRISPATSFGPTGGYRQGADEVFSFYEGYAKLLETGGDSSFEILHMAAGDGIAYWAGFQQLTAKLRGSTEVISMNWRVTEVFRREDDEWKLIHRHVDPLMSESEEVWK